MDYRESVKQVYGFDAWMRSPSQPLLQTLKIPSAFFQPFEVERQVVKPAYRGSKVTYFILFSPIVPVEERLLLKVYECESVDTAHEVLLDILSTFSLMDIPNGDTLGFSIGDVCFGSRGGLQVAMVFVRRNVVVDIRSIGRKKFLIVPLAEKLDQYIKGHCEDKK